MHTIWIKVQKNHISVYKDKTLVSSVSTTKFLTSADDKFTIAQTIQEAVIEAAESYDAEA